MTQHEDAIAILTERNTDGSLDQTIADAQAGKIKLAVLRFDNQRALELMVDNNILGRFDEPIALAKALKAEPAVYILPPT